MGCFSYLCNKCKKPIVSDTYGDRYNLDYCHLFLIKDGYIIEQKSGKYNSYGNIVNFEEWSVDWDTICDLHYGADKKNGILAFHQDCIDLTTVFKMSGSLLRSADDPGQGWGVALHNLNGIEEDIDFSKVDTYAVKYFEPGRLISILTLIDGATVDITHSWVANTLFEYYNLRVLAREKFISMIVDYFEENPEDLDNNNTTISEAVNSSSWSAGDGKYDIMLTESKLSNNPFM